jgi:hypothetical protein
MVQRKLANPAGNLGRNKSALRGKNRGDLKKTPRPRGKATLFDHDRQRGIALFLAGLAATCSPKACTIGTEDFNGRIRDGIGFKLLAAGKT